MCFRTVTAIGASAFYGEKFLRFVNETNFYNEIVMLIIAGNTALTSINITTSVVSIGEYAFYSSGLTKLSIPTSVTAINEVSFKELNSRIIFNV